MDTTAAKVLFRHHGRIVRVREAAAIDSTRRVDVRAPSGDIVKRAMDVLGAGLLLTVLAPILAVVAFAVRLSGPEPILFRQPRYGRGGRIFRIYKFRTMRGTVSCAAAIGDPADHTARVTSVGRYLRKYCIDELPQLLNVILGDMSLVGPRAHPVDLHVVGALYEHRFPDYHRRHAVRPGMTGLAQMSGFAGIVDTVEHGRQRLAYDVLYIGMRSLKLDLALLAFTAWRVVLRGGHDDTAFPLHRFSEKNLVPVAGLDVNALAGRSPGPPPVPNRDGLAGDRPSQAEPSQSGRGPARGASRPSAVSREAVNGPRQGSKARESRHAGWQLDEAVSRN